MNKLTKSAVLAAGVALATQMAQASGTDMVLGFTGNGATSDAVIDLGTAASFGIGGSAVVDLIDSRGASFSETGLSGASLQSLLGSVFTGVNGVNGANMTLAAGQNGTSTFFYLTQNRGMAGTDPTVPLSSGPTAWSKTSQASVGGYPAAVLNGATLTGVGQSAAVPLASGGSPNTASFSFLILGVGNTGNSVKNFQTYLPDTTVTGGKAYEDVWFHGPSGSWTYDGYLTLDLTGATTDVLTFTPAGVAVPEPSTYGLLAGLGLLVVAVRQQVAKKSA